MSCTQRRLYDATGKVEKSAGEEFVSEFGGGKFKDAVRDGELMSGGNGAGQGLADQIITTHESGDVTSHSAGFEVGEDVAGKGFGLTRCWVVGECFFVSVAKK